MFALSSSHLPPQYHSYTSIYILPLNQMDIDESDYQFYFSLKCPYAKMVEEDILIFLNQRRYSRWYFSIANDDFPSPTLRVKTKEGYINYRGVKQIKLAVI
jgi:hypothetical protein